ncbi:MAG TPA: proline dehydrogenase family protein [Cyclobacteriaceae bacterium]|jgi:proline dehydrogenase|nr:proline dehydrogenase family protein [Cyclobacteriaceae bacterium]
MKARPTVSFEDTDIAFSYKSDASLKRAHFIFSLVNHPWISSIATSVVKLALKIGLPIEGIIKKTVFYHFCGGESIEKSTEAIHQLAKYKVNTILDYSVEGEKSEEGFDQTLDEILRTVEKAKESKEIPFSVFKVTGLVSTDLLEKLQRLETLSSDEEAAWQRAKNRVNTICQKAFHYNVAVLIDAEETWIQNPIDALVYEMMAAYNKERAIVFNTYQLYRVDSLANLQQAFNEAKSENYFIGAKLVRGAYMEKERERAEAMGYESPIQPTKDATDKAFNKALAFCMQNHERIAVMCGSHNDYSNHYLTELMQEQDLDPHTDKVWFAQLYGMSDNISFNLAKAGYRVAKYVPYGPVKSVMPYLLRRADENTSVAGQSSRELTMIKKELRRRKAVAG